MFEVFSIFTGLATIWASFFFNVWLLRVTLPFIIGGFNE